MAAVSTITSFSNPSVSLREEGGLWSLKGRNSLSSLKRKQERPLKFVQASLSTISLFLPLASGHLSAFWKDVKKFNHHREWERGREKECADYFCFLCYSRFCFIFAFHPAHREQSCSLCACCLLKWMRDTNRPQIKRNEDKKELKKLAWLMIMAMDDSVIYFLTGPITESELTVHQRHKH